MSIDGHATQPAIVWSDSVCVCAGKTYTFSFWARGVYAAPQQVFDLDLLIGGISRKVVTISQQQLAWTQYSVTWTSLDTRCIPIAIKQTTGGAFRDFGIDDIYFGFCCDCVPQATVPDCCQFGLRLFNNVGNTFKKIKITPNIPTNLSNVFMDVPVDGDEWTLTNLGGGTAYEFTYLPGYFPANATNLMDVDLSLAVPTNANNPKITVEWIDGNNVTQKKEEIKLICMSDPASFGEDIEYDWLLNTAQISGNYTQSQVFSGAEIEPCSPPEYESKAEASCGGITGNVNCNGTNITLTANPVPNATEYHWNVNGSTVITNTPNFSSAQNLSGQGSIPVTLEAGYMKTVTDDDPASPNYGTSYQVFEILCTDINAIAYCILSAEFTWSKPEAICINGAFQSWKVVFTPLTTCSNITNYSWNFNDNTPIVQGSGTLSAQTHNFVTAGTYNVTLTLTDNKGCTSTIVKKLVINDTCTPEWHANYNWCSTKDMDPKKQYPITVTFTNQSLCICNSTFKWDFGDPGSGSANTANTTGCGATVSHTYMARPNDVFSVKLTMTDALCPNGVSIVHQVVLKPICNDFNAVVCPDGVVKFSTSCPGRHKWDLPNWQAITYNPAYYCLPAPFDPLLNVSLNLLLGLGQTSIPQFVLNTLSINNFELKFKDGANFVIGLSNYEDTNPYTTGTCTIRKDVKLIYTCCGNLKAKEFDYNSINNRDYRMTKVLKVKHVDKHGSIWQLGSCFNYYSSLIIGERTHFMARTILKKKKKVKGTSITYYFPSRASTVSSRIQGDFRTGNGTGCNCEDLYPWNTGLSRSNWWRATYRLTGSRLYKTQKVDLVKSKHTVVKNGVTWDGFMSKLSGSCTVTNGN